MWHTIKSSPSVNLKLCTYDAENKRLAWAPVAIERDLWASVGEPAKTRHFPLKREIHG